MTRIGRNLISMPAGLIGLVIRLRPARQEISCELWSSHFTRAEARERVTGSDEHRAIPNHPAERMPNQAADRR